MSYEVIRHAVHDGSHEPYALSDIRANNGTDYKNGAVVSLFPERAIINQHAANIITFSCSSFDFNRIQSIQEMKRFTQNAWLDAKKRWNHPTATLPQSEVTKIAVKLWTIRTDAYGVPGVKTMRKPVLSGKSFLHSAVDDDEVIDCTEDEHLEHAVNSNPNPGYYSPNLRHSYTVISSQDELYHHGILGQKWGVRRYQNADGSLTPQGKVRYGSEMAKALQKGDQRSYDKIRSKIKEGSDNDLLEKVANQLNDSGKKASKKNYSDALKKAEAEALENKRKEYARVVKEKVESGKEDNARLYTEYHDDLYNDKDNSVTKTSPDDYKRNGYMSNAERQTFNYAEKACASLPDDKKSYFLRQLSNSFDAVVRDNPSVLVWDNKKNKIVAYPTEYEFERVPDFEKYRDAWTSGNTVWLYTWGEQYDG